MSTIKISVADVEAMALDDYDGDLTVVEVGDWVSEGKYESCEVIFTDGERHYSAAAMRSGSYFSDYTYISEWDDGDADVIEVAEVPVTTTEWQTVLERGHAIYEVGAEECGWYCLNDEDLAALITELRDGDTDSPDSDFVTIIGPAVRTESGWHAPELEKMTKEAV